MAGLTTDSRQKALQAYSPSFFEIGYASPSCVPSSRMDCSYSQCEDKAFPYCDYPWDVRFKRLYRSQLGGDVTVIDLNSSMFPSGSELPPWITCDDVNPIYRNQEVTATAECSSDTIGDSVSVTIPEGEYIGYTQDQANNNAFAVAQRDAEEALNCKPKEMPFLFSEYGGGAAVHRNVLCNAEEPSDFLPYTQRRIVGTINGEETIFDIYTNTGPAFIAGWEDYGPLELIERDEDGNDFVLSNQYILVRTGESPYPNVLPLGSSFNSIHGLTPRWINFDVLTLPAFQGISTRDAWFNYFNLRSFTVNLKWKWKGEEIEDVVTATNFQPIGEPFGQQYDYLMAPGPTSSSLLFEETRTHGDISYKIQVCLNNYVEYDTTSHTAGLRQNIVVVVRDVMDNDPFIDVIYSIYVATEKWPALTFSYRYEKIGEVSYVQFLGVDPQPSSEIWVDEALLDPMHTPPTDSGVESFQISDIEFWQYL